MTEEKKEQIDLKRIEQCGMVFRANYTHILTSSKAYAELSKLNRMHSAQSFNKAVSFGLFPITALALGGHIAKMKPASTQMHMKVMLGVFGLAFATNIWAMSARSSLANYEQVLIDKYVLPLPQQTIDKYAKGVHIFPQAR